MATHGKREDPTGLYYFGARYYDPVTGRFTTRDTVFGDLADPQSLNRYSYCRNNPHKYVDPDGNVVSLAVAVLWAAFGGAVGYNAYAAYNHLVRNRGDLSAAAHTWDWYEAGACTATGAATFGGVYWSYEAILAATTAGAHENVYEYITHSVNSLDPIRAIQSHIDRAYKYFDDVYGETTKMTEWARTNLANRLIEWSQGSNNVRLVERINPDSSRTWAIAEQGSEWIIMWENKRLIQL